jgi:hypothetical protein
MIIFGQNIEAADTILPLMEFFLSIHLLLSVQSMYFFPGGKCWN